MFEICGENLKNKLTPLKPKFNMRNIYLVSKTY